MWVYVGLCWFNEVGLRLLSEYVSFDFAGLHISEYHENLVILVVLLGSTSAKIIKIQAFSMILLDAT